MKWLNLNINKIPLIMNEIDKISNIFLEKLNNIRKDECSIEDYNKFLSLRQDVIQRINTIDKFYEDNFSDPKIHHFELAKLKLKKILSYDVDLFTNGENCPLVNFTKLENDEIQYIIIE